MYTPRQLQLFSILMSRQTDNTISALADMLGLSDKTVKHEIKSINDRLPGGQSIQYIYGRGYTLDHIREDTLLEIARAVDQAKGKETHRSASIIVTLLFEKDYITMETVGRRLYLSKSAIRKEFEEWWRLREYIEVSHQRGLRICVPESAQRNLLTKFFARDQDLPALVGLQDIYQQLFRTLKTAVEAGFVAYNCIVSGESLRNFRTYLAICILRSRAAFIVEQPNARPLISPLLQSLALSVEQLTGYTLTPDELCYCQQQLDELNYIYAEPSATVRDDTSYRQVYDTFRHRVSHDLGIDLSLPPVQQEALFLQMRQTDKRITANHQLSNLYKRELHRQYPLTAHIAAQYLHPLMNPAMEDAEFSHIIPYFTAAENQIEPAPAILLSRQHPGLLHQAVLGLQNALMGAISEIQIMPPYQYRRLDMDAAADMPLLFTTEHDILMTLRHALYLKPIMNADDIFNTALQARLALKARNGEHLRAAVRRYISDGIFHPLPDKYTTMTELLTQLNLAPLPYAYEIVLDVNLAFLPRFLPGHGANQIEVFILRRPVLHRGRQIEAVVSSVCDPSLGDTRAFYHALRYLISPKTIKKAVHFFPD